jgi:pyridinium-3,5-biscarboxylic acid mononucleotide sulfurtransferase
VVQNLVAATSPLGDELDKKLSHLRGDLRALGSLIVCFSGGIDSALLLAVAHEELGDRALGITAVSPSLPESERREATTLAHALGVRHELVESNEIDDPAYVANNADRCFHCKTELYSLSQEQAQSRGYAHVAAGIIVDDLGDYRPGLTAAKNHGVRFPLVDAGFRKADVRAVAAHLGLPIWDKPAAACLSSRIAYGTPVTRERLRQVDGLESHLKSLDFRVVRVRYHELKQTDGGPSLSFARIELGPAELARATEPAVREGIVARGKALGFLFVTLDLAGYRLGSQNEALRQTSGADGKPGPKRLPIVG